MMNAGRSATEGNGRNATLGSGEPRSSRPDLPAAYRVPTGREGLLPWRWAEERLERARHYWVATVRPDGRPHCVPVWGLWVSRGFYFGGGGRKAANLATNPKVVVHLESGDEVIIVEGIAERARGLAPELVARMREASLEKYGAWSEPSEDAAEPLFVVQPRVVLAWSNMQRDATRWRFGGPGDRSGHHASRQSRPHSARRTRPGWRVVRGGALRAVPVRV
jgi:hypothetical protein